jgi:putative PIN family toxin of toxin-antitoxin system
MLRVVFDTVVFVRSLINPHSRCGKVIFSSSVSYRLFLSPPVLTEILEVLNRPELTKKFHRLREMNMTMVLNLLASADIVEIDPIEPVSRDVKDDKFLATAYTAKADYLVTEDNDLLVLEEYKGIKIITAEAFLEILERRST